MSIKKELLSELTEQQLKELAEDKGISFSVNDTRKKYYEGWDEKDRLVDIISDQKGITVSDVEAFIKLRK
ncbi:MAG: hypothetical protein JW771_01880 [Candidatus Thermoplasmatota archaeon]|nr:hypothetical protein [Candidatus Thermoplasmatota archaeon]